MTQESLRLWHGERAFQAPCRSRPGELGAPRSPLQGGDGDRERDVHGRSLQPGTGHSPAGHRALCWERGTERRGARRAWAYAGCLPDVLEEALGGDEELEQAAEPVSPVAGLQQPKHLAQDRGGRGFEGGVEGLEGTLHRRVQRAGVLREESVAGGRAAPQRDTVTPTEPVPTIPRCTVAPRLCRVPGTAAPPSSGGSQPPWADTGEEPGVEPSTAQPGRSSRAGSGSQHGAVV